MKNIKEYSSQTSAEELYHFLSHQIIQDNITSFSDLLEYVKELPRDRLVVQTCVDLFPLIRRLNWGFFSEVSKEAYPKIWDEIVIPHPQLKNCGNLKRNLTISDVYVGILDLHGYTNFCEKNKNNLSMLQLLDDIIQTDMVKIAREHNVVLQRHAGDEMVLVAASVVDIITTTLLIIGYFAKERHIKSDNSGLNKNAIALEDMHISAGIAGGKKFTPFIITKDGDLSGGVVNTAARLQSRANELSGKTSRILVSRSVYTSFLNEVKNGLPPQFKDNPISFFDCGWVNFKGISVAINEIIFKPEDQYRLKYEQTMAELFKSLENNAWKEHVFINLMLLFIRIYKTMPNFKFTLRSMGKPVEYANESFIYIATRALDQFKRKTEYHLAINSLEELLTLSENIPNFDSLSLDYAKRILGHYTMLSADFKERLDDKVKEKAPSVLPPTHRNFYESAAKNEAVKAKLDESIRASFTPQEQANLWASIIDEKSDILNFSIWSGKR